MQAQERQGIMFDIETAIKLVTYIDSEMLKIKESVEPVLPKRPLNKTEEKAWTPPKKLFKKDGSFSTLCEKWFDECVVYNDGGITLAQGIKNGIKVQLPCEKPIINELPMELKHQSDLKAWLVSIGWEPTLWNYQVKNGQKVRDERGQLVKTSPKLHQNGQLCPNLERLGDKIQIVKPITTWLSLRNRRSVLLNEDKGTGWLNHPRLKIDGRLPASSSGLTNTHREKHRVVANIPRSTSLLGAEFRSLFQAPKGKVLVGYDASSLEARVKGHYTYPFDNGEYADKLLDPDWDEHTENASVWLGKPMQDVQKDERQDIKPGTFALQYNCQPPTLARTLGVPLKQAEVWWNAYWEQNWALRSAIEETEREFEKNSKKFITTIDGSKIVTRAKHSVFNAKCQSAGQKIMNLSLVFMDKWLKQRGVPAQRVVVYHDEGLFQTSPEYAELVGELGVKSIVKAGEYFKMNVPLDGEYSVGQSWLECH